VGDTVGTSVVGAYDDGTDKDGGLVVCSTCVGGLFVATTK